MPKYLLLIITLSVLICSCKKATVKPLILDPVDDYLPTTPGSTWTYGEGTILDTSYYNGPIITMTMSGDTVNRYGKSFAIANASSANFDDRSQFYFAKSAGKYKVYTSIIHGFGSDQDIEVPILMRGNTNDRDTLFYVPDANPLLPPAYQIVSSAVRPLQVIYVQGKTYKNCSEVQVTINKRYDGDPSVTDTYYMYKFYNFVFAPGVGIIREYNNSQSMFLMSYSIK